MNKRHFTRAVLRQHLLGLHLRQRFVLFTHARARVSVAFASGAGLHLTSAVRMYLGVTVRLFEPVDHELESVFAQPSATLWLLERVWLVPVLARVHTTQRERDGV
jgi:hypothetical protein